MVTITDYQLRKTEEGKEFFALILQGQIEIVKSQNGGMYATARRVSLPSTFNEEICLSLVGQELPGCIQKVECEPYLYKLPESGEEIMMNYRYVYIDDAENVSATGSKQDKLKVLAN